MTRAERLAEQVRKAKDKLAAEAQRAKAALAVQRMAVQQAEAVQQADARKALTRRRYNVGYLAERHGLFAWSDADLDAMFEALALLVPCSNPLALLERLLAGASVDGADISLAALRDSLPSDALQDQGETFRFRPLELPTTLTVGK